MTQVKIVDIRDRPKLIGPGKREVNVEIIYETEKGYSGSVSLAKKDLSEENIQKAIRGDMEVQERILGETIKV
ncbi:MAG: hypothetical protein IMF19_04965 [Proteobacteria bacterium]|nr:hypothetical protein [Pseudomonadota bacterium]